MTDINRIFTESSLTIETGYNNTLCFVDGRLIDRSRYTMENNEISIYREATDYLSLFYSQNTSKTYYYEKVLNDYGVIVSGEDMQEKVMTGLKTNNVIIFVDGVALSKDEYQVLDEENVALLIVKEDTKFHKIAVFVSNSPLEFGYLSPNNKNVCSQCGEQFNGTLSQDGTWVCAKCGKKNNGELKNQIGYNRAYTLVFRNNKLLSADLLNTANGSTEILMNPIPSDVFTYYKLDSKTISFNFRATLGITTYGPMDDYKVYIPLVYDSCVVFDDLARLVVDDLRPGFMIIEKDRAGRLLIVDTDFETNKLKTRTLEDFSTTFYSKDDYYLEVPEAKSITDYLSEYEQKFEMLPDILRIFQRVLLDEIHDEVERIKNIRSVRKVDSQHIYKLLHLLGMSLDVKRLNLKQMTEIMDELNEFYRIAGTKQSMNFFNIIQDNTKIIEMRQLFTFHKKKEKAAEKKIYYYDYSLYNGDGGHGYIKGEKYNLIDYYSDTSGRDTGITVTIDSIIPGTGEILTFSADKTEGSSGISQYPLTLRTASTGATLSCISTPYVYNYDIALSGDSGGHEVGEILTTPLFEGQIRVTGVSDDHTGHITSFDFTPTQGTTSYENIKDAPLQTPSEVSKLQLEINAIDLSKDTVNTTVVNGEFDSRRLVGGNRTGNLNITIGETALYEIILSGAGGSGGAADTTIGSTNDSPASSGYAGEEIVKRLYCTAGTTLYCVLGEGGRPSYARGHGGCYTGQGGIGDTGGTMGYTKIKSCAPDAYHKHRMGISILSYHHYTINGMSTNSYVVSRAASGSGGGASSFTYMGKKYSAKGGDGGSATCSGKNGDNTYLEGGIGGNGGTKTGSGAIGGGRNPNNSSFISEAGKNGYIIIRKITQDYASKSKLINNYNINTEVGHVFTTLDKTFSFQVTGFNNGVITSFALAPTSGTKPIFTKDSTGEITSYTKTYDLVNTSVGVSMTMNQTINQYQYNVEINDFGNRYTVGQTLRDPDNIFTVRTTEQNDAGIITAYNYSPMKGAENITMNNVPLTADSGEGANIVINTIEDIASQNNTEREYVDFYLPEEQGAIPHKEYRYPSIDYGLVSQGSPGSPWPWSPGVADIDYGSVSEGSPNSPYPSGISPTSGEIAIGNPDIDYGFVKDKIKGEWVEWYEWIRPDGLYPTNHVEVEINVLSVEDYEQAMDRFYKQFYSLASAVLYIHRLITSYNFGNNTVANISVDSSTPSENKILIGFMTTQPFEEEIHTLTCDPARQLLPENNVEPEEESGDETESGEHIESGDIIESGGNVESGDETESGIEPESGEEQESGDNIESGENIESGYDEESGYYIESGESGF